MHDRNSKPFIKWQQTCFEYFIDMPENKCIMWTEEITSLNTAMIMYDDVHEQIYDHVKGSLHGGGQE